MPDTPATEPTPTPAREVKPLPGSPSALAGATENPPARKVKPDADTFTPGGPAREVKPLPA